MTSAKLKNSVQAMFYNIGKQAALHKVANPYRSILQSRDPMVNNYSRYSELPPEVQQKITEHMNNTYPGQQDQIGDNFLVDDPGIQQLTVDYNNPEYLSRYLLNNSNHNILGEGYPGFTL